MKAIAVLCSAAFIFATVAPAFAQPFADVPTNHWAYDAIAELAAKGLIEGYPDGTFKGDRAMTRYEMAMVVARLLARIESIQIPAPAAPGASAADLAALRNLTQQDFDTINRLVNEFRAELAALGVRTTAIEEELNAIKARLDNVRVNVGFRLRYDVEQATYGSASGTNNTGVGQTIVGGTPGSWNLGFVAAGATVSAGAGTAQFLQSGSSSPFGIDGNSRSSQINSSNAVTTARPRYEAKVDFDGTVDGNLHYVLAILTTGGYQIYNSGSYGGSTTTGPFGIQPSQAYPAGAISTLDNAFFDWRSAWGLPLEIRFGRFSDDTPCGTTCYPIQWGPFGLLMNDNGDTWEDSDGTGFNTADGLRISSHIPQLADLQFEFAIIRIGGNTGSPGSASVPQLSAGNYIFGEDAYGANANIQIIPGLRVGLDYVANNITPANNTAGPGGFGNIVDWHEYGPQGGSISPGLGASALTSGGFHCISVTNGSAEGAGIACPAQGNGIDGYIDWAIIPGVNFDGEYATWNDAVFGTSDDGWQVNFHVDLGTLTGVGHNWSLDAGYAYYGQNFYPPYGGAEIDINENDDMYPGDASGVVYATHFTVIPNWTLYFEGVNGNFNFTSDSIAVYEGGVIYNFSQNAVIVFKVRQESISGVQQFLLYRAQLDVNF